MTQGPGALRRGANFDYEGFAGPFSVDASDRPSDSGISFGFRGAR